jgi:hypothetical protein
MEKGKEIKKNIDELKDNPCFNNKIGIQTMYLSTALILSGIGKRLGEEIHKYQVINNILNSYIEEVKSINDSINDTNKKNWHFYEHPLKSFYPIQQMEQTQNQGFYSEQ